MTRCSECDQVHPWSHRVQQSGKRCIYHDLDTKVDKRLTAHRGLPDDCPGCLGHGTIIRRAYGRRGGDYALQCSDCRVTYHWSDR